MPPGIRSGRAGMTFVELIVALAIISVMGFVMVSGVHQLLTGSRQANDQHYAVSQLQYAEHYITRDVLMTWKISSSGFPLQLYWEAEDEEGDDVSYQVVYTLIGSEGNSRRLQRDLLVKNIATGVTVEASTSTAAQDIDVASFCSYDGTTLTVSLEALAPNSLDSTIETREFQVTPRKTDVEVI